MIGLLFNNKHSFTDFDLRFTGRVISTPSKKKIKDSAPGMHSVWDFSTIASNGEIVYNQRNIEVQFKLICTSKAQLHSQMSQVAQWLQDSPQSQLIFDDIKDYYFLAEVEDDISIIEKQNLAEINVTFICEPFKTSLDFVGNDIWDIFNFEEDYIQILNNFNVVSSLVTTVYNKGRLITPTINVTANMTVLVGTVTYNLIIGDNIPYGLKLQNGENILTFTGTGTAKVIFRAVSL